MDGGWLGWLAVVASGRWSLVTGHWSNWSAGGRGRKSKVMEMSRRSEGKEATMTIYLLQSYLIKDIKNSFRDVECTVPIDN